jgi:hypothetical protein
VGPSLSPAVRRTKSYLLDSFGPHIVGLAIGGLSLGLLAAGFGALLDLVMGGARYAVVLSIAGVYLIGESAGLEIWRPRATRQVPRNFARTIYHRTTAFLWGLDLGFGWSTKQPTSGFLVTFAGMAMLPADWALGGGVLFGLIRGTTILIGLGGKTVGEVEHRYDAVRAQKGLAQLGSIGSIAGVALAMALLL